MAEIRIKYFGNGEWDYEVNDWGTIPTGIETADVAVGEEVDCFFYAFGSVYDIKYECGIDEDSEFYDEDSTDEDIVRLLIGDEDADKMIALFAGDAIEEDEDFEDFEDFDDWEYYDYDEEQRLRREAYKYSV